MTPGPKTQTSISELPALLKDAVSRWCERLPDDCGELPIAVLRTVACSEFAASVLLREWSSVGDKIEGFDAPIEARHAREFADELGASNESLEVVKARLRQARNLRLLHILWREISGAAEFGETLEAISDTADQSLRAAANYALRQMQERFGLVRNSSGDIVPMLVIGMGKLGGRELNFSSDIDVIFCYPENGESDGKKSLHAQEYFDRLSRQVVGLMDDVTADGFVFRTDTRLRPFGESGPPVVSFPALESYLLQHGRDWERYAYIKASVVGQAPDPAIQEELFGSLIRPFVYRRYLDFGVFESLREMHDMISAEARRKGYENNVKLGPGGIREIEFIVQSLQLVRGGNRQELQQPGLLDVLPLLVGPRGVSAEQAEELAAAYRFLRRLENFIQAIRDKQTHDLPDSDEDRARLCLALRFADWTALLGELNQHRAAVSKLFDAIALRDADGGREKTQRQRFAECWEEQADTDRWRSALEHHGIADAASLAQHLVSFQHSPAVQQIDTKADERLQQFIPRLISLAAEGAAPALAMQRCLAVIEKVLRRSAYLALLNENRVAAERLVQLCEQSAYIVGEISRFPILLDELLDPNLLTEAISKTELLAELDEHLRRIDAGNSEARMESLAQFQRATKFRIAIADFNGSLPIMKVSDSLTFLAETVLADALATAWGDLVSKHGAPSYVVDGERRHAGFGIVAYGKLGGLELSYGSDLDIVFLHDSTGEAQHTDGEKSLDNALFFQRLVRRLVHFLTTHTRSGVLYEIDTRLRPSGRKGLLVTNIDAFERYQDENAWTWEHQALLRARPVAGSEAVGGAFERIRADTLQTRVHRDKLRDDVLEMRGKMRKELDRSDANRFDLKQGAGGIGDIEFLVQYLVLSHARGNDAVIEFTDNIRQLDALAASGIVPPAEARGLQDVYRSYRVRQHHLNLDNQPPIIDAAEFVAERQQVVQAWDRYFAA